MKHIIVYSTKSGNTEKVAQAIAQKLNCKAIKLLDETDFSTLSLEEYDLIFLGTWVRGGEPSPVMLKFLKQLNLPDGDRRFALFLTWAGGGKSDVLAFNRVKQILENKNQNLLDDYFKCFGKTFGFARRDHPNQQDLTNVVAWAKKICT
jgi:flavodoxin